MAADNRLIAKNTLILYGRMIIMMLVSLYTSRVILQNLGVEDYGIYGLVGGIVGFMGFLNTALATSSSRFLTFALGEGDLEKSKKTFSTTFTLHVILGVIILLIGEVIGPWMIETKLVIPIERIDAAQYAYQLSLLTTAIGVSQVPFSAIIVAHEKMNLYAYMAIVDGVVRLIIATSLSWCGGDKLVLFAVLLFVQSVGVMAFYRIYCARKFREAVICLKIDIPIFKQVASFSVWSLLQSFIQSISSANGTTMVLGMFFDPTVAAAKSISIRVGQVTTQFIGNFRQAMNPQIVKLYAQGEMEEYRKLTLRSGQYSFYIMWIMVLPICLVASKLLALWLGTPPELAAVFTIFQLVSTLFWLFDAAFQEGIVATGNIRNSSIWTCVTSGLSVVCLYIAYKLGGGALWAVYLNCIFGALCGLWIKPILLIRQAGFHWMDFLGMYFNSSKVAIVSAIIPCLVAYFWPEDTIFRMIIVAGIGFLCAGISILYIGLEKHVRIKLFVFIRRKVHINL